MSAENREIHTWCNQCEKNINIGDSMWFKGSERYCHIRCLVDSFDERGRDFDMRKPSGMTYKRNAIYAVYKNDEMVACGTADECAAALNVQPQFIHWMTTPTGKKRYENRKNKTKAQTAVVIDFE